MPWWKLDRNLRLRSYYLGSALTGAPSFLVEFFVLKILFGLPTLKLVLPWLLSSVLFVVLGEPLLRWDISVQFS
ncbi:MAG TPA: hypothetical protein VG322_17175 [Candidatus Acidoferrales bacterium]|jgi:hypothetical protein|nr:hypothetical protein [Candidatus Acidoferrales bacterium]